MRPARRRGTGRAARYGPYRLRGRREHVGLTPQFLVQRDGVHLAVDSKLDEPASLIGGFGFDVDPGVSEWTLQTGPGWTSTSRDHLRHFTTSNRKWVALGVSIELILRSSIPSGSRSCAYALKLLQS